MCPGQLKAQCGHHTSSDKYTILLIMQPKSILGFLVNKIHILVGKTGAQLSARTLKSSAWVQILALPFPGHMTLGK